MPIERFPDLSIYENSPDGLVGIGGDLHPESLLLAYRQGIFPWPVADPDVPDDAKDPYILAWFSPPKRAVLEFDRMHIPRSLEKSRRRSGFTVTFDQAFEEVVARCSEAERPGQDGTWITPWMVEAYIRFHRLGHAHSVEVWDRPAHAPGARLVGGLYGVDIDGAFAGESMFHLETDASKIAILGLADHARARGLDWMDIQQLTPHMERLGARELSRADFLARLAETRARGLRLFP